ncbi:MAG: c-type cytochrome biogenesis protein CcsB [Desulfobulbaceae bacterium]|nr:c-type cytochrome biogenesis protein CcsB [Desulfobulbaceae bacterium]
MLFTLTYILYGIATSAYLTFFISQEKKIRSTARCLLFGAGVLHTVTIVGRYIEQGHTPLTTHHDTVSFFAWSMTWAFLSFRWRYQVKNFGTFVSLLIMVLLTVGAMSSTRVIELPPALQSNWLPIHASIALLADGFLAMGFCSGVMYLLQERELKKKRFGLFYTRLPSLDSLDNLNHHCLTVGFPLLTLGIITGSFWAKQAWGSYWHWDPKETWSLITWFLYAAMLHQRFIAGWRGRRGAILSIIGFIAVLFTLWGVTFLLPGEHSYVN